MCAFPMPSPHLPAHFSRQRGLDKATCARMAEKLVIGAVTSIGAAKAPSGRRERRSLWVLFARHGAPGLPTQRSSDRLKGHRRFSNGKKEVCVVRFVYGAGGEHGEDFARRGLGHSAPSPGVADGLSHSLWRIINTVISSGRFRV
ncbi:unnamed protein product [Lampetra planeri]